MKHQPSSSSENKMFSPNYTLYTIQKKTRNVILSQHYHFGVVSKYFMTKHDVIFKEEKHSRNHSCHSEFPVVPFEWILCIMCCWSTFANDFKMFYLIRVTKVCIHPKKV